MPSPASAPARGPRDGADLAAVRHRAERGVRAAALLLLAALLWGSLAPAPRARGRAAVRMGGGLGAALDAWTLAPPADTLQLLADTAPDARFLDRLAALRRAGTAVTWADGGVPATAIALERAPDPEGGVRALVAAPAGTSVVLRDPFGAMDTLRSAAGGVSALLAPGESDVRAVVGTQGATAGAPDSLVLRHLVVLGRAGWESKFTVAALEERGWSVDARLAVAPGIEVVQGSPAALDTARAAAVIVLDSLPAADGARVAAFVGRGGGLVLSPSGARTPALAAIAPARAGREVRAATLAFTAASPRRALSFFPLALRADAVPLEARDGRVTAAARRAGAGRVVELGYEETWRWRLGGGAQAPEAHRAWWAAVVAGAAYRPAVRRGAGSSPGRSVNGAAVAHGAGADLARAAPRAAIFSALGPPTAEVTSSTGGTIPRPRVPSGLAAGIVLALLLVEWGSRRLRGAP